MKRMLLMSVGIFFATVYALCIHVALEPGAASKAPSGATSAYNFNLPVTLPSTCSVPGQPKAVCWWYVPGSKDCSSDGGKTFWPARHAGSGFMCYTADRGILK